MRKVLFTIGFFCFFSFFSYSQVYNVSVGGIINEKGSKEVLIGVNVVAFQDTSKNATPYMSVTTNKYGYYSLPSLPIGKWYILFQALGYEKRFLPILLTSSSSSQRLDCVLIKGTVELDQVVIEDRRKTDFTTTTGTFDINPEIVAQLPSIGGETDVFRALQLLPGVTAATELSTGVYVRGGSNDQNLSLIDGVQIYNPSHLGGFASTFNPESISGLKLIKGVFPAEFGGKLSSVLDVTMREGSKEKFSGVANINTISSRVTIEGPFSPKTSFIFSGRVMYLDKLLPLFPKAGSFPRYHFYDFNGKVNIQATESDKLSLSGFFSQDNVTEPSDNKDVGFDIGWRNSTLNLTWTKFSSAQLFTNTSLLFTSYNFSTLVRDKIPTANSIDFYTNSDVYDFTLKNESQYSLSGHLLKGGVGVTYHHLNVFTSDYYFEELKYRSNAGTNYNIIEGALFVQDEFDLWGNLKVNTGVRVPFFQEVGFLGLEPRVSLSVYLFDRLLLRAAFSTTSQPMHLLTRTDIYLPTDVYYPANKRIVPSKAMQGSLGFEATSIDRTFLFTVEGYYKDLSDIYEYKQSATFAYNTVFEDQLTKGTGFAYGLEFFLNKRLGDFNGWIGYTLAWTKRHFDDLNRGSWFYPRYDRRHDVSIVATYDFSDNWKIGATWVYGTGQAYSLPIMQYGITDVIHPNTNNFTLYYGYADRDAFRLPDFHKLDVSLKYISKWNEHDIEVSLDIYNVYNRFNAFSKYIGYKVDESTGKKEPVIKQFTLFPFLPSLGIKYRF